MDEYAHDELATALWDHASGHARHACQLYPGADAWDAQQLAISIGTSVELLIKHVLARRSFNLLADKFSIDTALTLDGKADESSLPSLTTVAVAAAFDRANKLFALDLVKRDYETIFDVRNAALHLGIAAEQANAEAFKQMAVLSGKLFDHLGVDHSRRTAYWGGAEAETFVEALLDEAANEVRARYEWLLSEARDAYQQLTENLVETGREVVVRQFAEVRPTLVPITEEAVAHQCPACQNMGWIVYAVNRSLPVVEYSDDEFGFLVSEAYVDRDGVARRFECGVCRLKLDRRDYLVEAGMPLEMALDSDEATEQEISDYEDAAIEQHFDRMSDEARGK